MPAAAILGHEEAASPDDFRLRLRAILSLAGAGEGAEALLARHGGQLLDRDEEGLIAVFPQVSDASAFARALRAEAAPRPAVGISLGAPSDPEDVAFAKELCRRAGAGEILISAVTGHRLTSRVRAEGPNEPLGWRVYILPAVGLAGFLGYFFGWFYAIYLKLAAYIETGTFTCWPEWLCR